ncbi:MAG: glucose-6-phosphate isomerase [Phycisphaerales bacterium]
MLSLDPVGSFSSRIGDAGYTPADLDAARPELARIAADLDATRGTGWERWRLLGDDPMRGEHVHAVQSIAGPLRGAIDTVIVLGIGGSALGNTALHSALRPATWNLLPAAQREGARVIVLDNVDPGPVADVIEMIQREDPSFDRTLINVVSKSGETAETAAQFLIFRDLVNAARGDRAAERIVAVTDPERGTMRSICDAAGYPTLPVPDGVGGRFSVLSPVGLFSAAMSGIDIESLLDGAAAMEARCRGGDPDSNPAAMLAWLLVANGRDRGRPIHVLMPYASGLHDMADWYRQLWAESLGKQTDAAGREVFTGFTPVRALGATDQHSQVQLYREGPDDKVIGLVHVGAFDRDVSMPKAVAEAPLDYLAGASLAGLLDAERRATEFALAESRRPTFTIRMDRLDAEHVGAFIMLWQMTTAWAGRMLGIDAYDQPAVETGKRATFGLMGKAGFEDWRARVDATLG